MIDWIEDKVINPLQGILGRGPDAINYGDIWSRTFDDPYAPPDYQSQAYNAMLADQANYQNQIKNLNDFMALQAAVQQMGGGSRAIDPRGANLRLPQIFPNLPAAQNPLWSGDRYARAGDLLSAFSPQTFQTGSGSPFTGFQIGDINVPVDETIIRPGYENQAYTQFLQEVLGSKENLLSNIENDLSTFTGGQPITATTDRMYGTGTMPQQSADAFADYLSQLGPEWQQYAETSMPVNVQTGGMSPNVVTDPVDPFAGMSPLSETDVMDSWMGLFGGATGAAPPVGNPAAAIELAGLAPSSQFAPPPYAGPSLEDALASEVAMVDDMVTTGMMDVDAAEMAYNQLLDKYITGFTGSTGQFVPGFVPRQQMVIDEYTQGVSDRDIARGEELLAMKQQMVDSGVNPDLIASDIEFVNALYDGVAETETNYLNAMRDIGLLAEASLRTEGAQRFGAARGDINRTSSMMRRQLDRDARQAETLGPEFGLDPAQYFTGTMAGLDMANIGESRRKERASAAERSLDRALDEAYRSAQLAMDQGAEPDYDIINWYMNQISQDPNVVLPDEIAPVVMKELAEAGMMDLLIPESSKPLTPNQEIDLLELMAMTSGQSTEYFIFAQSMAGLLDSAQINEIWTQATEDVALTRGSVLDAANRIVSEMGLG